jgi:hypothetical protein
MVFIVCLRKYDKKQDYDENEEDFFDKNSFIKV